MAMMKTTCWSALVVLAVATAAATDFPLEFKTVKIGDAMQFGGGSGGSGSLRLRKPSEIKKEPKAFSRLALYGFIGDASGDTSPYMAFRLDESKGTGKGYDRLIVDVNQNGDLTDDPVVKNYTPWLGGSTGSSTRDDILFGPISGPPGKLIAKGRPIFYAQAYVYNSGLKVNTMRDADNNYLGSLRWKAGWYLETTVKLDGLKQKIALYDANNNMRLGEPWRPTNYRGSDNEDSWYFRPGDNFLVDTDGSGKFESATSVSYAPILYLKNKPYKIALASDYKSIQIEPWAEPLADLDLRPQGDQVSSVVLASENAGQWQLIKPGLSNGRASVPPGQYRLYSGTLVPQASVDNQVRAGGYKRAVSEPVVVKVGSANTLLCGGPLQIQVTTSRGRFPEIVYSTDAKGIRTGRVVNSSSDMVRINGLVVGAGGEIYSSYGKGKDFKDDPPKPTFTVADAKGKLLASGNLEFG